MAGSTVRCTTNVFILFTFVDVEDSGSDFVEFVSGIWGAGTLVVDGFGDVVWDVEAFGVFGARIFFAGGEGATGLAG